MIECKVYTLTEFHKVLGFSMRHWKAHKEDFLEYLKDYFNYELLKVGRTWSFNIKEQYAEYQPMPKSYALDKIEKEKFYKSKTEEIVKKDAYNTTANIVRNIEHDCGRGPFDHSSNTMRHYVGAIVRKDYFSDKSDGQWMYREEDDLFYKPLSSEQLKTLKELFRNKEDFTMAQAELISKYKSGYLTKEETSEKLLKNLEVTYADVVGLFKERYGFWPIFVKRLEKKVF